jgi:broad specificity phosphatase PhoE
MGTMPSTSSGRLVLIRHGETEWSAAGRHTGLTDVPLTEHGEEQARALRSALAGLDVALALSSPLQRARRTAELAGLDPEIDGDLVEWDYGGYEGISTPEVRERTGNATWTVFDEGVVPGDTPGETVEEVAARASRVLQRVEEPLTRGDVVLVAHGHLLRILAATRLRQDARFGAHLLLHPATLSVVGEEHGVPALDRWNLEPARS